MSRYKNIYRIAFTIILLLSLIIAVFFVFNSIDSRPEKQPLVIVVLKTSDQSVDFWQSVRAGVNSAAKEFNVKVEIKAPQNETDIDGEIKILQDSIKEKPNAIVLAALDYNLCIPVCQQIVKSGIKLITMDSGINSNIPLSFVATDNIEASKNQGKELSSLLNTNSKIAIISIVNGASTAMDRENGLKLGLTKQQVENIVGTYYSNSLKSTAYDITKQLLLNHPDIEGIAALNEQGASGAAEAISELGLSGKVKLVGFDSSIEEIKYIESGTIQATVIQKPFNMGYIAVKTSYQAINHISVSKRINTGSQLITKSNMYSIENQKLLFPFIGS
jgi:ribose transport system substrate-binding protein